MKANYYALILCILSDKFNVDKALKALRIFPKIYKIRGLGY